VDGCTCSCAVGSLVSWRVVARGDAAVTRHCSGCGRDRAFASSGRFRVNASGRCLDVWLIYRCGSCGRTWNRAVHERVRPESLGADLERFHRNDPALAARCAGTGGDCSDYEVIGPIGRPLRVRLTVEGAVTVRLDRLLANQLGVSRAALAPMVSADANLRRPVRDGTVVVIHGCPTRR